ncbi:MAG TPA: cyclic nucleotide-binding domain-containing protein [Thermodesulforhabdus norvegica]|uniref:Cyclic nucleotide-binding domain-containing protein n=1 Tax=Thermodesulforhabdus norvegica TaxID=39841 RepID=A0A7C0WVN3_9BACT|nr:cyclic nucleotide-binding domain-containing protein [Deltaproteobacteria bacterium]MBW2069304.1 cyclic nucleotide-binding domain-containing protein [Deltaproteobacteria bacterium]HDL90570.1 cyclic nucleotide-binding domain-containing protein [Thermodesulforhabdus norvegica]
MISVNELKKCEFFRDFDDSELVQLAKLAFPSRWNEGELIFRSKTPAQHLYTLKKGAILLAYPNGRSIVVEKPGDTLGWSTLVSPFYHTATAICLTPVELIGFSKKDLFTLMQMDANLAQRIVQKIIPVMQQRRPYRRPSSPKQLEECQ